MKNTNQLVSACGSTARAQQREHGQHAPVSMKLRGDGGCFNPPCRQQSNALEAVFTRAPALCIKLKRISRPENDFVRWLIKSRAHMLACAHGFYSHDSGFVFYITSEESLMDETKGQNAASSVQASHRGFLLAAHKLFTEYGSYVTPGQSLTGWTFKKNLNRLVTLAAQGFQGGAYD